MRIKFICYAIKLLVFILCFSLLLSSFPLSSYGMTLQGQRTTSDLKDLTIKPQAGEPAKITIPQVKNPVQAEPIEIDSSASTWAVTEIRQAYEHGLTYPGIMYDYKKPITREEFCTIAVKLYEKLSKKTASAPGKVFTDTDNPEVEKANKLGIVNGTGGGKFSPGLQITRQEISVMIFRALGVAMPDLDKNSETSFDFVDRDQIAVWALDAMMYSYKHNILNGIGEGKIAPLMNTTREQAIAIIKRTYESFNNYKEPIAEIETRKGTDIISGPDKGIASGIGKDVVSGSDKGIASGLSRTDGSTLVITGTKTSGNSGIKNLKPGIELGIPSDIKNGLKKVPGTDISIKIIDATVMVGSSMPSKAPTEEEKAAMTGRNNKLAYPDYDTRLTLKAAMSESKQSEYSTADGAVLIDQDGEKKRWFSFDMHRTPGAKNVVWQISTAQFNGYSENWQNPLGLVKSGQVSAQSGEFLVDFATFAPEKTDANAYKIGAGGVLTWGGDKIYREIPTSRKIYYVRAVPVNGAGNCIGDPGPGMAVLYGKPITDISTRNQILSPSFEVWSPYTQGEPTNSPENPNPFEHKSSRNINCDYEDPYWFMFKGFDTDASQIAVQVSTKAFTGRVADWESPEGLIYTRSYKSPITEYYSGEWANSVPVDFSLFAPAAASMKPGDSIQYYLRAVALRPSSGAGSLGVAFSETIAVSYNKAMPIKLFEQETHTVKSYIPNIRILRYNPIEREEPDWHYHYEIYRAPKWNEIACDYRNTSGEVLKPYPWYLYNYEHVGLSEPPTPDIYETQMIPRVLTVGSKIEIRPEEEDSSFWGSLWDAIVDFFENLVELVKDVANWASTAYADLKSGIINFVANCIPLPGPLAAFREELKMALEALANAGLMALGLPPTLPNFDMLCEEGLGYLAEVALTEAGIPANDLTEQLLSDTVMAIGEEVGNSYEKEAPNPIDAPFLKNDPDYLETPAYIDVEISNPYDKPSLPGGFTISSKWPYSEDINVSSDIIAPDKQMGYLTHFLIGLKRGNEYKAYYPLFKEVPYKIPILNRGEKCEVRIYLEPYIGMPYPFAPQGDTVTELDFNMMYFGHFGEVEFDISTDTYNLPDAKAVAAAQGFKESGDKIYTYRYDKLFSSDGFTQYANEPYNP